MSRWTYLVLIVKLLKTTYRVVFLNQSKGGVHPVTFLLKRYPFEKYLLCVIYCLIVKPKNLIGRFQRSHLLIGVDCIICYTKKVMLSCINRWNSPCTWSIRSKSTVSCPWEGGRCVRRHCLVWKFAWPVCDFFPEESWKRGLHTSYSILA